MHVPTITRAVLLHGRSSSIDRQQYAHTPREKAGYSVSNHERSQPSHVASRAKISAVYQYERRKLVSQISVHWFRPHPHQAETREDAG
jgi:hypothetical protein